MAAYEDTIAFKSIRKPGYVSPAKKEEQGRSSFAQQLISALEDATAAAGHKRSIPQLAQSAFDKLKFDFPLLSAVEVSALVASFQKRLDAGKDPPFKLTAKLLENVAEAAKRVVPTGGAQPQPAGTSSVQETVTSSEAAAAAAASSGELVGLYQQLCACLAVKLPRWLLELPPEKAFEELSRYKVGGGEADLDGNATPQLESAAESSRLQQPAGTLTPPTESIEAPEVDEDDCAYEDLRPVAQATHFPTLLATGNRGGPASTSAQQPYTPQRLRDKLCGLASMAQYHLLIDGAVWGKLRTDEDTIRLLAAVRGHSQAPELRALLLPYLCLLADRLTAAPSELCLLQQAWEALGVPEAASAVRRKGSGLSVWERAAVSLAAALATQLVFPASRHQLREQVQEGLAPLLAQALAGFAAAKEAPAGAATADLILLCQVAEFYATAGAGKDALLQSGIYSSLVVLFSRLGAQEGAEPLRRVLLLAASTAPDLASWAAAVPGFTAKLSDLAFQENGLAEHHGACWQLLLSPASPTAAPTPPQLQRLLSAEHLEAEQQLTRLHRTLQLLRDMHAVVGPHWQLWGGAMETDLKALTAALRSNYAAGHGTAAVGEVSSTQEGLGTNEHADLGSAVQLLLEQNGRHGVSEPSNSSDDRAAFTSSTVGGLDAETEAKLRKAGGGVVGGQANRARQVQAACLKLLQELVVQERGKRD